MKRNPIIAIVFSLLLSCNTTTDNVDVEEAAQLVHLDSNDLATFSQLRLLLIKDSATIRQQHDKVTTPYNRTSWMSTNPYYLNQIDSSGYTLLYTNLKGKLESSISVNKNGSTVFTIKSRLQRHSDNYNETYAHELVNTDCNCPVKSRYSNVDTIFIDSVINKDWRYIFYKALTGH